MHDPTLQARHGRERRGRGKCDCCPYGYHLDLDFVRYCEKVSASGLLPGQRPTLHRPPTRKKRESRESLLGLTNQVSPTEGGRHEPTDLGKVYDRQASEDLEKAVLDFEKIFNSSTRSQSNDERVSPLPRVEPSVDVKYHTLPGDRLNQPLDLLKLNGTNNASPLILQEIRHQMAASLCRMRQLEEEVKAIPNLQNQLKKLRWENRRLVKLLDSPEKKKDKVGEIGEKRTIGVGYRVMQREVGTSCRVELRSVSTQGVSVNSGSDVGLSYRVETKSVGTEGEAVRSYRDVGLSCQVETKSVGTEGEAVRSYRDVGLSCQVETISVGTVSEVEPRRDIGLSCRFPTFDAAVQHRGPAVTEAASQAQLALLLRPDRHVGVQVNTHAKKAFTCHVSVQHDSDSKTLMTPTSSTDSNTQTDLKAPEKKHIAVQNKPLISDIGTLTNYRTFEHSTQTVKSTSRDFGLTVNTLPSKAHNNIGVNTSPPEKSRQYTVGTSTDNTSSHHRSTQCLRSASRDIGLTVDLMPNKIPQKTVGCNTTSTEDQKPITASRLTDTSGLVKVTEMAVNTSAETSASEVSAKKALSRERLHLNLNSPTGRDKSKIMSHIPIYQHSSGQSRRDERGRGGGDEEQRHGEEEAGGGRGKVFHQQPPSPSPPVSPLQAVLSTPLDKPYQKKEPSKEMKGAMKVLHDNLLKSPSGEFPRNLRNAVNIVQQEWFKVSSQADANPLDVEDYLDSFEEMSVPLLEYIVNMTDVSGNTAMHYAVSNGNFDVVSILLDSKVCNINKLNRAGYTCIMLVALTKVKSEADRQVVRRLFQMADVNIRARQHGQTALMLAVSHGRIDTVELLLESGADINIQDEDGSTALMCAAEHGHIDIVKLLLAQSDCDLSLTDLDGNTALNIAMEAGNRDIGVLLYAQEHFSRGASPMGSLKMRRAKSATPTLKTRTPTPPNSTLEHSL